MLLCPDRANALLPYVVIPQIILEHHVGRLVPHHVDQAVGWPFGDWISTLSR